VQIVLNYGSGPTALTLCHGHARTLGNAQGPIGELVISGDLAVQTRMPIRRAHARPVGRGGQVSTIAFTVEIEFATLALAEAYISTFLAGIVPAGTLVITYDGAGTRTFADAALSGFRLVNVGVTLRIDYTFTAGGSS